MKFSTYLKKVFKEKQKKNSNYSLRAFARDLGISSGRLTEILNNKSGITKDYAQNIAKKLKLNEIDSAQLVYLAAKSYSKNKDEIIQAQADVIKNKYSQLNNDLYDIVSEWQHFAILELTHTNKIKHTDYQLIADAFDLNIDTVTTSVDRLIRSKLLKIENGFLFDASKFITTSDNISNKAIKEFHKQILIKAISAIDIQNVERRNFQSYILSIDKNEIPWAKKEIETFTNSLSHKLKKTKKPNGVYCLHINFFDLIK